MREEDPTIAGLLKAHGYATGQFGKNHLGDTRRAPAHQPRLRRVLRQPLPPQRRGGAGERGLPRRHGARRRLDLPREVRPARRDPSPPPTAQHRGHRPADQEADGDRRRRDRRRGHRLHRATRTPPASRSSSGGTAPACTSAPTSRTRAWPRHLRPGRVLRRHGRARHARRQVARSCSTSSASPTTPSCSTRPTTAPTTTPGRTRPRRRSAARRTPTGRAAGGCPRWCAGRARSRPAR